MKIFVGGVMAPRQQRLRELFPSIEFSFASDQERDGKWMSRAAGVDYRIVDQGRCSHRIMGSMRRKYGQVYMADGNAAIYLLIKEIMNGKAGHHYTRAAGSESVAWSSSFADHYGQCNLPAWLAEVDAGGDHGQPAGEGEEA